jgi:oligopeptide transport system substrate-binding protein
MQRTKRAMLVVLLALGPAALEGCRSRAPDQRYCGAAEPRHGPDELWINNTTEPESLDPALCADNVGGELVVNLFAGLVQPHPQSLAPLPDVATSWEIGADGRTYTFELRDSLWSDGQPVVASDFAYAWKRVLAPETASKNASLLYVLAGARAYHEQAVVLGGVPAASTPESLRRALPAVGASEIQVLGSDALLFVKAAGKDGGAQRQELLAALAGAEIDGHRLAVHLADASLVGVRAVTPHRLEVQLEQPTPYFLDLARHYALMPVPKHVVEAAPEAWARDPVHLTSNGPYRVREARFRDHLLLEKNERYWDAASVRTPRIKLLEIESSTTALSMYEAGYLDWIGSNTSLPPEAIERLRSCADYAASPTLSSYWYWLNTRRPPLDDVRVRRALSLAIDRDRLVAAVKRGAEVPTAGLVPKNLVGYTPAAAPETNPEEARRLLAAAGFPGGKGWPGLTLSYNTGEGHRLLAEAVQQMWRRELGIEVQLASVEWRVLLENLAAGRFDIARLGWSADYPDAANILEVLRGASGNNHSGWRDDKFESLLAEASRTTARAPRAELLRQAEAIALEAQPLLPLYAITRKHLQKPYVRGLWMNYQDRHPFKALWLDDNWRPGKEAKNPLPAWAMESR